MFFVIICQDKPDHLALRLQNRPEHLKYVASYEASVKIAGARLTPEGDSPCGSILIVEMADLAEAERFAKNDPYNKAGLFEKVTIMPYRPAVGDWLPAKLNP